MEIRANLVLDSNGAMSLAGTSHALSSHGDRSRFHEIRHWADAILIGGLTSRVEPYSTTPTPLFIWSRGKELAGRSASNAQAQIMNGELADVITAIAATGAKRLLCEGGPFLLNQLVGGNYLDAIYLTETQEVGDDNFFDRAVLMSGFIERERNKIGSEVQSYLERN